MPDFDFACDARVGLTISAPTEAEARKQWETFCQQMARCDSFIGNRPGTPAFHVALLDMDEGPEIEIVE